MTKTEIIHKLRDNHKRFADDVSAMSEANFTFSLAGKWIAGQQLEHIYKSVAPLTMALGLPKFILRWRIGKANRPSTDYDGLVAKYNAALDKGGVAPSKFVPREVPYEQKEKLVSVLKQNIEKCITNINKYSEQDLDYYILPHPLIGKLTVREMLYFTIHHCEHHHKVAIQNLVYYPMS
jgi:hypothetical protein